MVGDGLARDKHRDSGCLFLVTDGLGGNIDLVHDTVVVLNRRARVGPSLSFGRVGLVVVFDVLHLDFQLWHDNLLGGRDGSDSGRGGTRGGVGGTKFVLGHCECVDGKHGAA